MSLLQSLKKEFSFISLLSSILFIAGLLVTVCEVDIYRNTFINYRIPVAIWLLSGLIPAIAFRRFWVKHICTESLFFILVYNICTWGGFTVYLFMASNFYFVQKITTYTEVQHIISTGKLAKGRSGCGEPYADIIHYGEEKELVFGCDVPVSTFNAVELKIQKGLLGYEVITEKRLLKL